MTAKDDAGNCGKVVYMTKERAKLAARKQKDKGKLWPYRCNACDPGGDGVWHLTSQPTSQRTRWRDRHRIFGE